MTPNGTRVPRYGLQVREVAVSIGTSDKTVRRLIQRGELPSFSIGSRRLVRPIDLERFIDGQVDE